jgi:uncharacterized membrane protein YccC
MAAVRERLRDPVVWGNAFLLVKAVGAAVIAWVLARSVFGLAQPFLAPWAALLTVHATVYRTLTRGLQQVAAAVLGVLLAVAANAALGVTAASLGAMLLVAMAIGTTRVLRDESTTAAATALVVLLTGYSGDGSMLVERLSDTVIGIAVGLLVNLLIWPPLRDRTAARQLDVIDDRLGALLGDMAADMRAGRDLEQAEAWVERTRELDQDISEAWAVFRQARESGRLNLRRTAAARVVASHELVPLLARLEQAVADTRSMAGTIGRAAPVAGWDARFRHTWLDLVSRAGTAVSEADAAAITRVREDLEAAAREWFHEEADGARGPVHGALIVNLRNILEAMDAVAEAQPIDVQARPVLALTR